MRQWRCLRGRWNPLGLVGCECSAVCPRGPSGSRSSCSEAFSINKKRYLRTVVADGYSRNR